MEYHTPVLLEETLHYLNVENGKKFIDCTLGNGGHTLEFLKKGAIVLGIDYDPNSLETALERIRRHNLADNFVGVVGNFRNISQIAESHGFDSVDGILFDLGYSSSQILDSDIGMSFMNDAPLDMRIDKTLNVTAADLLNTLSEKQLARLFKEYGEERASKQFAKAIVVRRELKQFQTTKDLVDLLVAETSLGYDSKKIHPATRVFQALRIVVNDELENLKNSLPRAVRLLKLPAGRMGVISFHSLEDRVVKEFGHDYARPQEGFYLESLTKKPVIPSPAEVKSNSRARSAKFRVFEKKVDA